MKKITFLFCFFSLFFNYAFAEIENKETLLQVSSSETSLLNERKNYFLTSTDYKIIPKVNPITGEYCEEELDLVVTGITPLSIRRFYNSKAPYDPRYAHWRYNPESFFVANFEWPEQKIFASIGDYDGSICSFKHTDSSFYLLDIPKNFLFIHNEGSSHSLNTTVHYQKIIDSKNKQHYEGTITDGTGRIRSFCSESHSWTQHIQWIEKKKGFGWKSETTWLIFPNTWTPYHLPITEEKLPNGNILCYTYIPWKKDAYPLPQLLQTITAYNSDKSKVLGFIHLEYKKDKENSITSIHIKGSDGRLALLKHSEKPGKLTSACTPGKPSINYVYGKKGITTIYKSYQEILITEYTKEGKVSAQYAPVGTEGQLTTIGRYIYEDFMTQVFDAEGLRIDYHFDSNKFLTSLVYHNYNAPYKKEVFERDETTGNLLKKTLLDGNDNPLFITEYIYDKNHNPIEEKKGWGSEWHIIKRTFSEDGFNLKLTETDREGKLTQYTYIPGTNLLASELVYEGEIIRKRSFYIYDDCAICIKTVIDDGNTKDPENLAGVTYRKITSITPKYSIPCFGLPEVIEEKTLNDLGEEILLSKKVITYTSFGAILQEDHYDASGCYVYSLYNTYDNQERLVSKTDPLGYKIVYTYDNFNNIISIKGPRQDQYQEIFYDKANRPIKIVDYLETPLITEKKYNKLGQVIEETNPCGQKTRFIYDNLGRLIESHHPENKTIYKEYDVFDNIIKEIDFQGNQTLKTYNPFGQVTYIQYADGTQEFFTYNSTGTVASHKNRNGVTVKTTYDIFDHPITQEIFSSSGKLVKIKTQTWSPFCLLHESEEDITYIYDYAGRKIQEIQKDRSTKFFYDSLGRVHCENTEDINKITEYDLRGLPIHKTTEYKGKQQKKESFFYDEAGFCISLLNSQGQTSFSYNSLGQLTSKTDSLGFTTYIFFLALLKPL